MTFKKRGELFRDTKNGKIAGVCAGISDFFGWEAWLVRIFFVSALLLGSGFVFVIYIAAWFILDKKQDHVADANTQIPVKGQRFDSHYQEQKTADEDESIKVKARIWQNGEPPKQAFHDIHRKFKRLEGKLIAMERYVTSSEFIVSREINNL
ncbi:MAG: envelope stress response membrane protein PspC [Thalassotalea sp.]